MFGKNITQGLIRVSFIERFKLLNIRFCKIDYEIADTELFELIYENNLYALEFANIVHLLKIKYGVEESDDFKHKNYTLIKKQPDSPLNAYIDNEIHNYLIENLANCNGKIEEDEQAVLMILNNSDLETEQKVNYIDVLKTVIHSLADVTNENLWKGLIMSNLVMRTEENVINYFVKCGNDLTDEIIQFINGEEKKYDFSKSKQLHERDIQRAFFNAIVRSNQLNNKYYEQFLVTLGWCYNSSFSVEDIIKEKMDILIKRKIVKMHETSLTFIRENYPLNLVNYIVANIKGYCELVNESELFNNDEGVALLAENISDVFKIKLLKNVNEVLTAINDAYSDEVKTFILTNNFYAEDLSHFASHYDKEEEKTKAAIVLRVLNWLKTEPNDSLPVSADLFDDILALDKNISSEEKTILFSHLLAVLDETQCKYYLKILKLDVFLGLFERKRPQIIINNTNYKDTGNISSE